MAAECFGIAYGGGNKCVVHSPAACEEALGELRRGAPLSWGAGLEVDEELMNQILDARPADAEGWRTMPEVDFSAARFLGPAQFAACLFEGNARFNRCEFLQGAEFGSARFDNGCQFEAAVFRDRAFFKAAVIRHEAVLRKAVFHGTVGFRFVTADGADLSEASFLPTTSGSVVLEECQSLNLDQCTFEGDVEVSCMDSQVCSMVGATVKSRIPDWIMVADQKIDLSSSVLDIPFEIRVQAPQIQATGIRTGGRGRFAFLGDLDLSELDSGAELLLEPLAEDSEYGFDPGELPARIVSLQRASLAEVSISGVDLSQCRFAGAHGLDRLQLEGVRFAQPPPTRWAKRQTIVEENIWRKQAGHGADWHPRDGGPPERPDSKSPDLAPERIATVYRALRKGREDSKDIPGGADFYFGEMEMRRHAGAGFGKALPRSTSGAERLIITTYWLVSGYGLRASRAIAWWLLTILVVAGGLSAWGFEDDQSYPRSVLAAIQGSTTFLRPSSADLTCAGEALEILLRLLGPLFFGLALLAVRARVKR